MPEINLLKNRLSGRTSLSLARSSIVGLYVIIGVLILEVLVYGFFVFYEQYLAKQILAVEQANAGIEFEIGKSDKDRLEALSFQTRLNNLQVLLASHLYWSRVFKELEKVTYRSAVYKTLQAQEADQTLILTGTVPTYTDLAKLILGLETSPHIREVKLLSSGRDKSEEGGYAFNLEVEFDPKLLVK